MASVLKQKLVDLKLENEGLEDKVNDLTRQLVEEKRKSEQAEFQLENYLRKVQLLEEDLEKAEDTVSNAAGKAKDLEAELEENKRDMKALNAENSLLQNQVKELQSSSAQETDSEKIKDLECKLREAETRAIFAEKSEKTLRAAVDNLERQRSAAE